jgi:hypothetical protein
MCKSERSCSIHLRTQMENKLKIAMAAEVVRANRRHSRHERRQESLHAACNEIAALRQAGVQIGRSIRLVARKFHGRRLGGWRRLPLSHKRMRAHWDAWNAAERDESVFRARYKAGHAKIEIDRELLSCIASFCIQRGRSLRCFARTFKPRTANGKPIREWTLYRRLNARAIQHAAFLHRNLIRNDIEVSMNVSNSFTNRGCEQ